MFYFLEFYIIETLFSFPFIKLRPKIFPAKTYRSGVKSVLGQFNIVKSLTVHKPINTRNIARTDTQKNEHSHIMNYRDEYMGVRR